MGQELVHLVPQGVRHEAGQVWLEWAVGGLLSDTLRLGYALPAEHAGLFVDECQGDHVLVAVLLAVMAQGKGLRLEGRVSPILLDNLEMLQEMWCRWRPDRYSRSVIQVEKEGEADVASLQRGNVIAFSGGVDACFSLFRHLKANAGRNTLAPDAALLIHGMDIPLERIDWYTGAVDRAKSMLMDHEIALLQMKTNARSLPQPWEDSFGTQLGAAFLALQRGYACAIKGSEEPYEAVFYPWGSTPLTDPLLSTGTMQIIHDGCSHDRTEKVRWLAENTVVADRLRVCWAGENLDRNCGRCEKCVRTMLNFWAAGKAIPSAFPVPLTGALVRRIHLRSAHQRTEMKSILRHAQRNHRQGDPVMRALKAILRRAYRAQVYQWLRYRFGLLFGRG